jgi:fumarate reductase subunit D
MAGRTAGAKRVGRSPEPFLWLLFSAGGVASALLLPILILLFAVAFPLGWISPPDHDHLLAVVRHPVTRLALVGFAALALVHAAHRLRYTLYDGLQVKHLNELIAVLCYGGALVGSLVAAYVVFIAV